jgi:hypothetical protein
VDRPLSAIVSTRSHRLSLNESETSPHTQDDDSATEGGALEQLFGDLQLFGWIITDLNQFSRSAQPMGPRHLHHSPISRLAAPRRMALSIGR